MVAGATSRHSSAAASARRSPPWKSTAASAVSSAPRRAATGARFAAPARDAGAVGGGEDGGEAIGAQGRGLPPAPVGAVAPEAGQHAGGLGAADGGPGQGGPEGDGGDPERGGGRRAALLEQPAEVGGQRGIGRRRGAAPGVELPQRAAIGRAGVGAHRVRGEAPGGRGGRGERPGRGAAGPRGEGVRGPAVIRLLPHNGNYRARSTRRCSGGAAAGHGGPGRAASRAVAGAQQTTPPPQRHPGGPRPPARRPARGDGRAGA